MTAERVPPPEFVPLRERHGIHHGTCPESCWCSDPCARCGYEGRPPHYCYGDSPPRTQPRPPRRMTKCESYAVDQGLVIDCILPTGHTESHDCGEIDWSMAPNATAQGGDNGHRHAPTPAPRGDYPPETIITDDSTRS